MSFGAKIAIIWVIVAIGVLALVIERAVDGAKFNDRCLAAGGVPHKRICLQPNAVIHLKGAS